MKEIKADMMEVVKQFWNSGNYNPNEYCNIRVATGKYTAIYYHGNCIVSRLASSNDKSYEISDLNILGTFEKNIIEAVKIVQ